MLWLIIALIVGVLVLQAVTLLTILREDKSLTTSIAQLDAAIAAQAASDQAELQTLQGATTKIAADVATLLADVEAGGTVDVTAELTAINANTAALKAGVDSAVASLGAADASVNLSVDHTSASLSVSGAGGLAASQVVNAADPGQTGPITATSSDPTIATVAPASANGPTAAFTITAVAPGSAIVTIADSRTPAESAQVTVGVVA